MPATNDFVEIEKVGMMKRYQKPSLLSILLLISGIVLLSGCQPQTTISITPQTEVSRPLTANTATVAISQSPVMELTSTIVATETPTTTPTPIPPSPTPQLTDMRRPTITPTFASPTLPLSGWLVFSSVRLDTNEDEVVNLADGRHLYTLDLAASEVTAITSGVYQDLEPTWSPDGTQIVFSSNRTTSGSFDLFVINRDGSDLRQLTNIPENARTPVWSPDGLHIAFVMTERLNTGVDHHQIGLYFMADGHIEQLTSSLDPIENSESPAWSPDGRYLSFTTREKSLLDSSRYITSIYLVAIDTFERFRLERDDEMSHNAANPVWIPGEKQIIAWERGPGDYSHLDMLLFEIEWQENEPVLNQLPVVLTDLWGTPAWTTEGVWAIYVISNARNPNDAWFTGLDIAAAFVNLPSRLTVNDGRIQQISLFFDMDQFLTDNQFLDSDPSWIP